MMPPIPDHEMAIWTIYDHPLDYPDFYVARLFLVRPGQTEPVATQHVLWSSDLEKLRDYFWQNSGFHCVARSDGDDPCIVESWL